LKHLEKAIFCNNGAIAQEGITPETHTIASFFYTEGLKMYAQNF